MSRSLPNRTILAALLLSAGLQPAPRAAAASPALERLDGIRLATAVEADEEVLDFPVSGFDGALHDFILTEGAALRPLLREDAKNFLAIILDAGKAKYLGYQIGIFGNLRLALYRHAVLRRTGEELDVVVWDRWLSFFLRDAEGAVDAISSQLKLLLRQFIKAMEEPPTVPSRPPGAHPCPPFRPFTYRLRVRLRDEELLLSYGPLDIEVAVRDGMEQIAPFLLGTLDPIADNGLEVQVECRTIYWEGTRFGIGGTTRLNYFEPVLVNNGRSCLPGATWMSGKSFFVDTREEADEAILRQLGQLIRDFADFRYEIAKEDRKKIEELRKRLERSSSSAATPAPAAPGAAAAPEDDAGTAETGGEP